MPLSMLTTYSAHLYIFPVSAMVSTASNISSLRSLPRPVGVSAMAIILATTCGVQACIWLIITPLGFFPDVDHVSSSTNPSLILTNTSSPWFDNPVNLEITSLEISTGQSK